MRRLLAVLVLALAVPAPVVAAQERPTLAELEPELMCPACDTTLEQSDSPIANEMRRFIRARIAAGDSESEIKRKLVAQFGEGILAAPPKQGFGLLAWVLPLAGLVLAALVLTVLVGRWSRRRLPPVEEADPARNGRVRLEPELERRLDEELARFE